jgi:hypothetical protein
VLVDHAWVQPVPAAPRSEPGRAPSPAFEVHPVLLGESDPLSPGNLSTQSTLPTELPALLGLAQAIAPEFLSTQSTVSTETSEADQGSVENVESAEPSSRAHAAVPRVAVMADARRARSDVHSLQA